MVLKVCRQYQRRAEVIPDFDATPENSSCRSPEIASDCANGVNKVTSHSAMRGGPTNDSCGIMSTSQPNLDLRSSFEALDACDLPRQFHSLKRGSIVSIFRPAPASDRRFGI